MAKPKKLSDAEKLKMLAMSQAMGEVNAGMVKEREKRLRKNKGKGKK